MAQIPSTPLLSTPRAAPPLRGLFLFVMLLIVPTVVWAAVPTPVSLDLSGGVRALIRDDGGLTLALDDGSLALMTGHLQAPAAVRRPRRAGPETSAWLGRSFEGAEGGLRGFSSRADDDSDGQVDEDPLDGMDNDGDGLVDEDFGAVSDAMTAVRLSAGGSDLRVEYYHWSDVRLKGAVILSLPPRETAGLLGDAYEVNSGAGAWHEADLALSRHTVAGKLETARGAALVAHDEGLGGSGLWLGVMDLGAAATGTYLNRPVLDGAGLTFGLADARRNVALCVARSRLQLERLLLESARLHRGVSDPATGRSVPWIMGPACSVCRLGEAPSLSWQETGDRQVALVLQVASDGPALMDPDLLALGGLPLAAPVTLSWHPADGPVVERPWTSVRVSDAVWPRPFGDMPDLLGHGAEGTLVLTLPLTVEALEQRLVAAGEDPVLTGLWLDGRPFALGVPATIGQPAPVEPDPEPETVVRPVDLNDPNYGQERLTLSRDLLEGYPNPFRDVIQIRFQVPATVADAFDWSQMEALPESGEMQIPVSWPSGQPRATVKIYSVNGQELVTLHQGTLGEGRYTAQWNGTDGFGRKVASGTYFCKLQLDDWSVTRRVVFLR